MGVLLCLVLSWTLDPVAMLPQCVRWSSGSCSSQGKDVEISHLPSKDEQRLLTISSLFLVTTSLVTWQCFPLCLENNKWWGRQNPNELSKWVSYPSANALHVCVSVCLSVSVWTVSPPSSSGLPVSEAAGIVGRDSPPTSSGSLALPSSLASAQRVHTHTTLTLLSTCSPTNHWANFQIVHKLTSTTSTTLHLTHSKTTAPYSGMGHVCFTIMPILILFQGYTVPLLG